MSDSSTSTSDRALATSPNAITPSVWPLVTRPLTSSSSWSSATSIRLLSSSLSTVSVMATVRLLVWPHPPDEERIGDIAMLLGPPIGSRHCRVRIGSQREGGQYAVDDPQTPVRMVVTIFSEVKGSSPSERQIPPPALRYPRFERASTHIRNTSEAPALRCSRARPER